MFNQRQLLINANLNDDTDEDEYAKTPTHKCQCRQLALHTDD
jgi:hypothetical protein